MIRGNGKKGYVDVDRVDASVLLAELNTSRPMTPDPRVNIQYEYESLEFTNISALDSCISRIAGITLNVSLDLHVYHFLINKLIDYVLSLYRLIIII